MNGQQPQPVRLAHLASYLRELVRDVSAEGKIAKIQGNPVQVAAVALLSGGIAVAEAFAHDLKVLSGGMKANAKMLARPALETAAAKGVGMLMDKIFGGR